MKSIFLGLMSLFLVSELVHAVTPAQQVQTPIKREILEMTELSERRIRQSLQDFLGPDTRSVVNVYFKERDFSVPAPELKAEQPLSDSNWMLSGPYVPENPSVETPQSGSVFQIDSAEVSIQVEKIVNADARKQIESLVKAILRGVPVKVSVASSLPQPLAKLEEEKKSQENSRSPASLAESVDDAFEKFTKRYAPYVPFAASVLILFGVLVVAFMQKSSAREIAEGLRSIRSGVSDGGAKTISLTGPTDSLTPSKEGPRRIAPPPPPFSPMGSEARKNLQSIESALIHSPLLFTRSLTNEPSDLMGIKFLVSRFSDNSRAKLKELIGVERILKASHYQAGEEVVGFNAAGWLQQLIEKIEFKKLAGGTIVEEALSGEESLLLSSASQEDLLKAALKINTPAAWRVVTDFVPSEFMEKFSFEFDREMWSKILKSALVKEAKEVREAAFELIEIVRASDSQNVVSIKSVRERDEHFSKRLLPSLLNTVRHQDLGQDDEFLKFLIEENPEFEDSLRATLWTPSRLIEVSDALLRKIFIDLGNEKMAQLIVALPEPHSKRLESYLPDGNIKQIVTNMVARMRATTDQDVKDRARHFAREFLEGLRVKLAQQETPEPQRKAS